MIIRREENRFGWHRRGLRTRYEPKARICKGLINAAPWLNIILLVFAFVLLLPRVVLRPGIYVELPETTLAAKAGRCVSAVILSHQLSPSSEARSEMIFFDDEPFAVEKPAQMRELGLRLSKLAHERPGTLLMVEADVHVKYGTIVNLCTMAGKAGMRTVNLAGRASEERARNSE